VGGLVIINTCKEEGARLFLVVPSDRTRGDGHRLKHRRFPLHTRKLSTGEGDHVLAQVAQDAVQPSSLEAKGLGGPA